jgi:hypothetical protein
MVTWLLSKLSSPCSYIKTAVQPTQSSSPPDKGIRGQATAGIHRGLRVALEVIDSAQNAVSSRLRGNDEYEEVFGQGVVVQSLYDASVNKVLSDASKQSEF